ncbi:MAG: hypothetical protein MUP10_04010 [Methanoregulaceae archaeon]|nr:hypothetical protein [Methanoregulaceae archaeon]
MLTSGIRFLPPRTLGQRTFIALVRESDFSHDLGSLVMVQPLALIVEEDADLAVTLQPRDGVNGYSLHFFTLLPMMEAGRAYL